MSEEERAAALINAAAAVEALRARFPSLVTTSDDPSAYSTQQSEPWSKTCWQPAAAYVELKTSQDVSDALQIVKRRGCKFAVRSAGHNPNPGFSSVDETGVVFDVRGLDGREMGEDGIAKCGAGNIWGDVYQWLEEKGLSAIGGRDCQVGLAGFLLGGGLGAFPNLHGLGSDNVVNFEVALSDGSIVNANINENKDLFRALKGGGTNFGIVTRFDLKTYPLIKCQYNISLYDPEDYVNINRATAKVQEAMDADAKIGLFTNYNAGFVAVGLLYADHPDERPAAFEPFDHLGSLMQTVCPTTNGTLATLAATMGHAQEAKRRYVGTLTTKVSVKLYNEARNIWLGICRSHLPKDAALHYTIQPIGPACVQEGGVRGDNHLGLEATPQCWWVFTCEWTDERDDTGARKAVDEALTLLQESAFNDSYLDFLFMSFASSSQYVLGSYGEANFRKLQEVASKYDAEGVFQTLQHGGFLLRQGLEPDVPNWHKRLQNGSERTR